jgi:hypothetical protein
MLSIDLTQAKLRMQSIPGSHCLEMTVLIQCKNEEGNEAGVGPCEELKYKKSRSRLNPVAI